MAPVGPAEADHVDEVGDSAGLQVGERWEVEKCWFVRLDRRGRGW